MKNLKERHGYEIVQLPNGEFMVRAIRWFEKVRRYHFGQWAVVKIRKRLSVRERITILAGVSRVMAEKEKIALEKTHEEGISYEVERTEV